MVDIAVRGAGGGMRRIATAAQPTWSPNGEKLAFGCGQDICASNVDGSERRRLTNAAPSGGSFGYPAWSPDGKLIAYVCTFDICVVKSDGTGNKTLIRGTTKTFFDHLVWSPDSQAIALSCSLKGLETCVVNLAEEKLHTVTGTKAADGWTPDGRIVVHTSGRSTKARPVFNDYRLYTLKTDGSGRTPLGASTPVRGPGWSPSGNSFLFWGAGTKEAAAQNQLWEVGRDGKYMRKILTLPSGYISIGWVWQPSARS